MTCLQTNVPEETAALDQSNTLIKEIKLISHNNLNQLSLLSKIVLFLYFFEV